MRHFQKSALFPNLESVLNQGTSDAAFKEGSGDRERRLKRKAESMAERTEMIPVRNDGAALSNEYSAEAEKEKKGTPLEHSSPDAEIREPLGNPLSGGAFAGSRYSPESEQPNK
jgi:hypothetical protein